MEIKAVVVHSGGMDSSLCLASAIKTYGAEHVLSLSFSYNQRHSIELERAKMICEKWAVAHRVLDISCLSQITHNSLTDHQVDIAYENGEPNSLVVGRNGLMGRIAAIHANSLGASAIYMGVIEVEEANSGYRDCSRFYMDKLESLLKIDLNDQDFKIITPLVKMTKEQTMLFGYELGVLEYLLETTVSCYQGVDKQGCMKCPACKLRNEGIKKFLAEYKDIAFSYKSKI